MIKNQQILYVAVILTVALICAPYATASVLMKPTPNDELVYQKTLTPKNVDQRITKPEVVLGFEVGQRTATPAQITELVTRWAKESNKVAYQQYATSYEGRPLHLLAISSPKNLSNIDKIQANVQQLAKPKALSTAQTNRLIDEMPAIAWMAYSIHGNESSGADSALALIYHLIASQDQDVTSLLDNMVILVDPVMNPDGRARFTKMLEQHRGTAANVDSQSLLHAGVWPYGRTNHYYYDLNRDFYFLQAPETRGRVAYINKWYPQLMIDGHEMGSLDTYLFGPAREPINTNLPQSKKKWGEVFAKEQASAFDQQGWTYYTGEWFENLYPGYSNYAEYRGAVHILYEQARTAEDGIRLPNGKIRTYKESVHQQLASSFANLQTLAKNSKAMYRDFVSDRRFVTSDKSPYADKSYVVLPSKNNTRIAKFVELLKAQDIEVLTTTKAIKVKQVLDQLGTKYSTKTVPVGSIIVNARQPEARLLNAILEFDAEITDAVLLEEWQRTMRDGSSLMYDNTAWNLTMLHGLEAWQVGQEITSNTEVYDSNKQTTQAAQPALAWLAHGDNDSSVAFAARLMEQGVKVRLINKQGELSGIRYSRGSVVVLKSDNQGNEQLSSLVTTVANELSLPLDAINVGLGDGDFADIGGSHFELLTQPKIAIASRGAVSPYDFGAIWHMLDTNLGIRHSHVDLNNMARADLRQYNVIVLPHTYGKIEKSTLSALEAWVKQGGTLIAIEGATRALIAAEIPSVVSLDKALKEASKYDLSLQREWLAKQNTILNKQFVASNTVPEAIALPWLASSKLESLDKDQLKLWDEWAQKFMPSGAMVASRTDQKHWLTFGVTQTLPLLISNPPLLMSDDSSVAAVRMGTFVKNEKAKSRKLGWSTIPEGYDITVRMSGLLWPEAAQRIANSAYLTQESKGRGQLILFAGQPIFRGATKGTERLLMNAIVFGPGLGASQAINL